MKAPPATAQPPISRAPMPLMAQMGMATARRVVMANRAVMVAQIQQPAATTCPRGMKWPGAGGQGGKGEGEASLWATCRSCRGAGILRADYCCGTSARPHLLDRLHACAMAETSRYDTGKQQQPPRRSRRTRHAAQRAGQGLHERPPERDVAQLRGGGLEGGAHPGVDRRQDLLIASTGRGRGGRVVWRRHWRKSARMAGVGRQRAAAQGLSAAGCASRWMGAGAGQGQAGGQGAGGPGLATTWAQGRATNRISSVIAHFSRIEAKFMSTVVRSLCFCAAWLLSEPIGSNSSTFMADAAQRRDRRCP